MVLTPALTYRLVGYSIYTLDFCGLNAIQVGNRRKPTALATTFKVWAMTSQALSPTKILLDVLVETKTLLRHTVKIQIHNSIKFFYVEFVNFLRFFHSEFNPFGMKKFSTS